MCDRSKRNRIQISLIVQSEDVRIALSLYYGKELSINFDQSNFQSTSRGSNQTEAIAIETRKSCCILHHVAITF